jgi:preprotein translocase subunit SecG
MEFGIAQIISGALLLILGVLVIVLTVFQTPKQQNMGSAFGGGESDNFYGKNGTGGSSKEAALIRLTKVLGVIFFILVVVVNVLAVILKPE